MNDVAQIAALVAAVTYIGAAPMELFFFNKPWAQSRAGHDRVEPATLGRTGCGRDVAM